MLDFLTFGYVRGEPTLYRGIRKLPPGVVDRQDKMGFPTPLGIWLREAQDDPRLRESVREGRGAAA